MICYKQILSAAEIAMSEKSVGGDPLSIFYVHPIDLVFYDLPANSEARITLHPDKNAKWGSGEPQSRMVGISLSATRGNTLCLSTFTVNQRELYIATYAACSEIHVRLYLHALEPSFSGRADLPVLSSVTIASSLDRTSLIERGLSSFTMALR